MKDKIVIKIGSDVLTSKNGLNLKRITSLSREIDRVRKSSNEVIIVSSGAIASGAKKAGLKARPDCMADKRALSAIGQCYLMEAWIKAFRSSLVAQVLLTWKDISDEESKLKAREILLNLVQRNVTPIVNENDATCDEEIGFSDNDQLALMVAKLVHAQRLILLTNVDGLFTKNPEKHKCTKLIKKVRCVDERLKSLAGESKSSFGTGGMLSKLIVAEEAMSLGITMNILNGKRDGLLIDLVQNGVNHGTEFKKRAARLYSSKV